MAYSMVTRTLSSADVERVLDWDGLLRSLERAHRSLARGGAVQLTPHALRHPDDEDDDEAPAVIPMASFDSELGIFAVKVLADAPRNRALGLPAQRSTVCLFSSSTGECLAVIDGRALTRIRTAAVTAIATRALARPDSRVVTLLGSGDLAIEHALALARVHELDEIRLWSRSAERSAAGAAELRRHSLPAVAVPTLEHAVSGAHIVCTLTPARDPLIGASLIEEGMHINAVGSPPRPLFAELAPEVVGRASVVVVDSRAVALGDSGNIHRALAAGTLESASLVELGEVLIGTAVGRQSLDEVTIYNSVGIGLQDLAAADHVLRRATELGAGTMVNIRG